MTLAPRRGRGKKRDAAAAEISGTLSTVAREANDAGAMRRAARLLPVEPDDSDAELFESLRALRQRLADEEGVPAYIVFSDAVLRGMVRAMPRTRAALLEVSGIGPVKLERYGDAFLEILCAHGTPAEATPESSVPVDS